MHNYAAPPISGTRSLMFITHRPNVTFVRGQGSWLFDEDNKPYLDFVQGWAVNSLGHSPRIVLDPLMAQSERVLNVSPAYYNEPMCRLAELLARLSQLDRVLRIAAQRRMKERSSWRANGVP